MELTLAVFALFGSCALVLAFMPISRTRHAWSKAHSPARRVICQLRIWRGRYALHTGSPKHHNPTRH